MVERRIVRSARRAASRCQVVEDLIDGGMADGRENERVLVRHGLLDAHSADAVHGVQMLGDGAHRGRLAEDLDRDHGP